VQTINGMFGRCYKIEELNLSNFNLKNLTIQFEQYYHFLHLMTGLKVLNLGDFNINEAVDFIDFASSATVDINNSLPSLEKVIVNNPSVANRVVNMLPDRSTAATVGYVVTNANLSDATINALSAKNWSLRKMVAQYKFDAVTYENLIPEFNAEFTEADYIITDSVSESVIDDIQWTDGYALTADTGVLTDVDDSHVSDFIVIQPNVAYKVNQPTYAYWYDENKVFINNDYVSEEDYNAGNDNMVSPVNARYVRFVQYSYREGLEVESKVVEKIDIEKISINGDLIAVLIIII
jgi:surface protein